MDRVAFNAMLAQYATPEVSGDGRVSWDGGVRCVIPSVRLYGKCQQDGTPTPDAPVEIKCNNGVFESCGKNLFDADTFEEIALTVSTQSIKYIDGVRCLSFQNWAMPNAKFKDTAIKPNGLASYTLQMRVKPDVDTPPSNAGTLYVNLVDDDGKKVSKSFDYDDGEWKTVKITAGKFRNCSVRFGYGYQLRWAVDLESISCYANDAESGYTPYYDGGQATAPELYAIPGTEYRDEWDAQTGRGVRRCAIIESYAGEAITTPYISSTGELSEGATVVYGISDTPFYATPARLTMPPGAGQIIQTGGDVADCPVSARYLTHS